MLIRKLPKNGGCRKGETNFEEFLDENPLPASIDFNTRSNYVQKDSLSAIKASLEQNAMVVQSVNYPASLIEKMGPTMQYILIGLIVLAGVFSILSIVLIDNTIRLAMYSNRFLIKTMQMVGATRNFISTPDEYPGYCKWLAGRHDFNCPDLCDYPSFRKLFTLPEGSSGQQQTYYTFSFLILLGISISLFSTHRSVVKYLKMKLDDLY